MYDHPSDVIAVEGGAQQDRLDGGAHEPAVRLARRLGDRVRLGTPVDRVAQDEHVVVVASGDRAWRAAHVVMAIPPTLSGRVTYEPPLPSARDGLSQRLPMAP